MSFCPNYNLPQYSQLKSLYGEGGANLAANLFDSPSFQQWKGDGELPRLEGSTVFNNRGEGFDLSPLLESRLSHLEQQWEVSGQTFSPAKAQALVEAFNQSLGGKNYVASVEDGQVRVDYSATSREMVFSALPSENSTPISASLPQESLSPSGLGFYEQMDGYRKLIGERREKARKAQNMTKVKELDELLTFLSPAIAEAKALSGFIDSFHQDMFGREQETGEDGQVIRGSRKGNLERMRETATRIKQEYGKSPENRDITYLSQAMPFLENIGAVAAQVEELRNLSFLPGKDTLRMEHSPLSKLDEVLKGKDEVVMLLNQVRRQALASSLSPHLTSSAQLAQQEYLLKKGKLEELVAKAPNEKNRAYNQGKLDQLEEKYRKLHWDEARLFQELETNTEDISILGKLLESPSSSKNGILGAFYRYLEDLFHKAQVSLQPLSQRAFREYQDFRKAVPQGGKLNPDKQFEGLYEEVESYDRSQGKWVKTLALVQETDWTSYNKARARAQDRADGVSDAPQDPQRRAVLASFYREHTVPLTTAEREDLIAQKREWVKDGSWTNREFQEWEASNWYTNSHTGEKYPIRDFQKPKPSLYTNSQWKALQGDPARKQFYDFLLETRRKSQAAYHPSLRDEYRLPSIRKEWKEKVIGSGGKVPGNVGEWWDSLKGVFNQDASHDELKYGNLDKTIPTLYLQPMAGEEVSRDLLTSVMLEAQAAAQYKARQEAKPLAEVLVDTLKDSEVEVKDSAGRTLLNQAARAVGLPGVGLTDQGDRKGGNLSQAVSNLVDRLIYGQEKVETKIGSVSADKVVDTMMGGAAMTGISGVWNTWKALANHLNAKVSVGLEALLGKHFTASDMARGEAWYATHYMGNGEGIRDTNAGTPLSLFGQLMYQYGAIPGRSEEEFGRHLTQTTGGKVWETVFGSGLMKLGEAGAQGPMFATMGLKQKLVGRDGQEVPLLEAYTLGEDGTPILKANFQDSWSAKQEAAFRNKVQGLSLLLQGNYSHLTKPEASRHLVGRVLLMYKKFLEPSAQRRFGQLKVNQQLGDLTEGHYRTFFQAAWEGWRASGLAITQYGDRLTPSERQRALGAMKEFGVIALLSTLAIVLKGLGDEDKELGDSYVYQASLYELLKMESELKFFLPAVGASDQLRIFSSPTALTTPVTKALTLGKMVVNPFSWNDTYEKGSRFHEKGDYKLVAALSSLLGVYGLSPDRGLAQFELFNR